MASRRTHTKSRTGCLNCKRRKVKCDEARPSCFHCKRHGVECSLSLPSSINESGETYTPNLPDLTPSTPGSLENIQVDSPAHFQDYTHPNPADQIAPFPAHELWARDCELMHHYCTVTAESLSIRKDLIYVWSVAIPRLGYQDPFVMHGILAIAAAHKAYMVPASRKTYLPLADYHQTLGSEGYRRQLQNFDPSNWMPIFGFASVVVLHMLTLSMRSENGVLENPINNIIEVASLVRGIRTTLEPVLGRIVRTEFAPVVFGIWPLNHNEEEESYPSLENTVLPVDSWVALKRLRAFQESDIPANGLQHYAAALDKLETSVRLLAAAGAHTEAGAVQFWLYAIDDSVLLDLAARRSHALLLFAYWLVHWAVLERKFWYLRGWSRQIMNKIEEALIGRTMFLEMLHWPKQKVAESLAYT
ncbi:hypothetical protein LB507_003430 [Fusarium sp. FIESC RH6]|nr:hypothetical protein LB507_003430 [Fusarium sp. FIESC RH6]